MCKIGKALKTVGCRGIFRQSKSIFIYNLNLYKIHNWHYLLRNSTGAFLASCGYEKILAKRNVCKKIKRIFHKKEKLYVQLIVFLMNLEYGISRVSSSHGRKTTQPEGRESRYNYKESVKNPPFPLVPVDKNKRVSYNIIIKHSCIF